MARKIASITYRILRWGDERLPFGVRSVVGVLFVVAGLVGWIPGLFVIGVWMVPLGAALVALDIPPTRHKIHAWMLSLKARAEL